MSFATHALITGSNRGLGLEFVRQLVDDVTLLFATCRRPQAATELQALAEAHPETIRILPLDVGDPDSIEAVAERVASETEGLDLLVNNAGVDGGGTDDTFGDCDHETLVHTFRVNAAGPHVMVQTFAPLLRRGATAYGTARVLNVTSQLGSIENTKGRGTWQSYKASKSALNMLTRLQSHELRTDDVSVVAVHPGWVQTDMGGSNARLTPQESVSGMLEVARTLDPSDGGTFLSYDGSELPW